MKKIAEYIKAKEEVINDELYKKIKREYMPISLQGWNLDIQRGGFENQDEDAIGLEKYLKKKYYVIETIDMIPELNKIFGNSNNLSTYKKIVSKLGLKEVINNKTIKGAIGKLSNGKEVGVDWQKKYSRSDRNKFTAVVLFIQS